MYTLNCLPYVRTVKKQRRLARLFVVQGTQCKCYAVDWCFWPLLFQEALGRPKQHPLIGRAGFQDHGKQSAGVLASATRLQSKPGANKPPECLRRLPYQFPKNRKDFYWFDGLLLKIPCSHYCRGGSKQCDGRVLLL